MLSLSRPASLQAAAASAPADGFRGLKVGIASYSLRKFTLDQTIAMTRELGLRYLTLKDMHLPYDSSTEERKAAQRKAREAGIVLMGAGVVYMGANEAEIRSRFEYARDAGFPTLVASPDPKGLDMVEKLAREFDCRIAIHNHGPGDQRYPSPIDVLRMVENRDSRLGICMDLGHTVRLGQEPVGVMKQCARRLYDFHIKDVTAATPAGKAIEIGRGIIDIVGVLRALLGMRFADHVALEHELNADNPMPGMLESFAYVRGVLAALA